MSADWIEIVIPATAASVEDVAALIMDEVAAAQHGTEVRTDEVVFWVPVESCETTLLEVRQAAQRMAEAGLAVDAARVAARSTMPEAEWRDAWKRYFHVIRLTRQLVIVPSWESYQPIADDIVIDLDPGQAFGTGAHGSTRLVLETMQELRDQGTQVTRFFDVGTGSGILAIFAAKLWPGCTGVAVDVEALAVAAAAENAANNHVAERIECSATPAAEVPGQFDLVLANIQADVLLALREAIAARIAPGGLVILSGLLTVQVDAVAAAYTRDGTLALEAVRRAQDPDWSSATLRRIG